MSGGIEMGTPVENVKVRDVMREEFVAVSEDATISEAIGKMKKMGVPDLLVVRSGTKDEVLGMVSYDVLLRRKKLSPQTKVSHVMSPVPSLSEGESVVDAAEKILSIGVKSLPVVRDGRVVGMVFRRDIARSLANVREAKEMAVHAVMTPEPKAVLESEKLSRAIEVMRELDERFVPVVNGENRLLGVVGSKEIVDLYSPQRRERFGEVSGEKTPAEVVVSSIMRPPVAVDPDTPVSKAVKLMAEHDIPSVLVTEEGKLVGVVTEVDLLEMLVSLREKEQVFVQISGLDNVDPDVYDTLYEIIQKGLKRIAKFFPPRSLSIHVTEYKKSGGETKWSVHMRLITERRVFYARSFDWSIYKAFADGLEELEKIARREKDRLKTETRALSR